MSNLEDQNYNFVGYVFLIVLLLILLYGCKTISKAELKDYYALPPQPMMILPVDTNYIVYKSSQTVIYVYPCNKGKRDIAEYHRDNSWTKWQLSIHKERCKKHHKRH